MSMRGKLIIGMSIFVAASTVLMAVAQPNSDRIFATFLVVILTFTIVFLQLTIEDLKLRA